MTSQEVIIVETDSSKLEECKSPKEYLNKLYKSSVEDETKADLQDLDSSVEKIHSLQVSRLKSDKPGSYLKDVWETSEHSQETKKQLDQTINDIDSNIIDGIKNNTIPIAKPVKISKHNMEQKIAEERMRKLQQRHRELKQKFEELDSSLIVISPEQDRKDRERIRYEMEKLDSIFTSYSPTANNRKKTEYVKASDLQKRVYAPEKGNTAREFVENIQKEWSDFERKKEERASRREKSENEKINRIKQQMEEDHQRDQQQKRERLEQRLAELKSREEARKKLQEEWKQVDEEYSSKKPLYKIKEEQYLNEVVQREEEEKQRLLQEREKMFQPASDNLFKEHQKNFKQKLEMLRLEKEQKRREGLREHKSPEIYHGRFHSIVEDEDRMFKHSFVKRVEDGKDSYEKRNKYAQFVKETIKIKINTKETETSISPELRSKIATKTGTSNERTLNPKEVFRLGLKYLDYSKSLAKKKNTTEESASADLKQESEVTKSQNIKSSELPAVNNIRASADHALSTGRSQSYHSSRIDYLPVLRKQFEAKGVKKQPEWKGIMESDMLKQDKYELMKISIEQYENSAKRAETRIKYSTKNAKSAEDHGSLDEYYLNSVKAKLALLREL